MSKKKHHKQIELEPNGRKQRKQIDNKIMMELRRHTLKSVILQYLKKDIEDGLADGVPQEMGQPIHVSSIEFDSFEGNDIHISVSGKSEFEEGNVKWSGELFFNVEEDLWFDDDGLEIED